MIYPVVSNSNYLSITLLKKMERAPEVLAVLDANWGQVGGNSIFDDFDNFGGPSQPK